jgi:5'-methylthioadenosine phosphorylase
MDCALIKKQGTVFLQRHGNPPLPPHRINHQAQVFAMKQLVFKLLLPSIRLKHETRYQTGTFLIPDDFLSLWHIPTFLTTKCFLDPQLDSFFAESSPRYCKSLKIPAEKVECISRPTDRDLRQKQRFHAQEILAMLWG